MLLTGRTALRPPLNCFWPNGVLKKAKDSGPCGAHHWERERENFVPRAEASPLHKKKVVFWVRWYEYGSRNGFGICMVEKKA